MQFNGVTVPSSGTYGVAVSYANNDRGGAAGGSYNTNVIDRLADISINGGQTQPYYFRNTYGWNSYRSVVLNLPLNSGANTLTFGNPTGYAPNLSSIEIAPLTIQTVSYEAESPDNRLAGSATVTDDSLASGGKFVSGIGNGRGNTLTFRGVQVPAAGTYKMVIYFAGERDLSATVTTNDSAAQNVSFLSSRATDLVNTQIVDVTLKTGSNEITFSRDVGPAPAIDKIELVL